MIFNIGHALLSLRPGTEWSVTDNVLTWRDSTPQPTDDEINAEIARLQAEYDNNVYQRNRAAAYPSVVDQLDKMFHSGFQAWKDEIQKVKEKYPKP